jgi:capsular polysaccharide biosynthesis protein
VIGRATSAPPALLGRPGVLGAAFAVAFIWLAITLAFVLDGADKRLRNTTSIEDLYGKPVFNPVG